MAYRIRQILVAAIAVTLAVSAPAAAVGTRSTGAVAGASPVGVPTTSPTSAPPTVSDPSIATYNGGTIDLSVGWDGAQACIVPSGAQTECFSTLAEAQSAAQAISQQEVATGGSSSGSNVRRASVATARAALRGRTVVPHSPCESDGGQWLWLYQNANYGGQALGVQDVDTWWNLYDLGFADEMSSYSNDTGCTVYMIQNPDGSGPWLTASPWGFSSYVGSTWNDTVVGVDIAY